MISSPIVPAIIPQSLEQLQQQLSMLRGVPEIHLDVVDGVFAPTLSWPYSTGENPTGITALLDPFSWEVHLMVENQMEAAETFVAAGADQIVFHAERITKNELESFINRYSVTVGVTALNDTPYDVLKPLLIYADYVQVMGIKTIGNYGQILDGRVFLRIEMIQKDFPDLPISIDGSINKKTILQFRPYGIHRYIVGSAIMKSSNLIKEYEALTQLSRSS
jgi:ribulose-phosphate 3-epimerase